MSIRDAFSSAKIKLLFTKYGYVAVGTHTVLSLLSMGMWYQLIHQGLVSK